MTAVPDSPRRPLAAVVTVGSELTTGLRLDTNGQEIAAALTERGLRVVECVSAPDDLGVLEGLLARLVDDMDAVVVTGGLGPTHDDVTREAAAAALGLPLHRDDDIVARLQASVDRHADPAARAQVTRQADVLAGATVLAAIKGTAPGQLVVSPGRATLMLLPGPPVEMRPLLAAGLPLLPGAERAPSRVLSCVGMSESDVQVRVERVLAGTSGIGFTVLASMARVSVVLSDEGAGEVALTSRVAAAADVLGGVCYSTEGRGLEESVLALARERGVKVATAESCTGGMVAAALTDVAGSSDVFLGGVVSYSNEVKMTALDVPAGMLAQSGAVSEPVAVAMARGARARLGADLAVAITGVAGPAGGTPDKPVGTVWFAVADGAGFHAESAHFPGDRAMVRMRSTTRALDLVRRRLAGAR